MKEPSFSISGQIVDIVNRRIFPGTITVEGAFIASIKEEPVQETDYILPGFIDAHVHIESSLVVPSEFARVAPIHGTVATVSDPHEIANVLGLAGIRYMIENARLVPFKFYFGASSCVPATRFETAGATVTCEDIEMLFRDEGVKYLSEMMNYPGVLHHDPEVMAKIACAKLYNRPIDGHAPGLMGKEAADYISAGISTDHECYRLDEAKNKIAHGVNIIIREGTAAKNFEALHPLFKSSPEKLMFCSDDKHIDDLVDGHINVLCRRALEKGYDLMDILRAASLKPIEHYGLDVGLLRPGDAADFIVIKEKDFTQFIPSATFINGRCVAIEGISLINRQPVEVLNHFDTSPKTEAQFRVKVNPDDTHLRVIVACDGELITKSKTTSLHVDAEGYVEADVKNDILKIAVVNRYEPAEPSVAFITNFGFKQGACASTVAHDSHNIIAVGTSDRLIAKAVNALIASKGGLVAVTETEEKKIALPIAGLMSNDD
ncbi:MAG: adenine deaminase, partial [Verrucomicrobia bacterium]|nr:adenine deaminase [Verrucomicrobiota bacterium]